MMTVADATMKAAIVEMPMLTWRMGHFAAAAPAQTLPA